MKLEEEIQTTFKTEKEQVYLNILFTANWLKYPLEKIFKPYQLSMQQYNVLRILRGYKEPMTVNNIKSRMVDKTPNVTRLTDKLIEKNLVKRVNCEHDRRVIYIQLLEEGKKRCEEITAQIEKKKEEIIVLSEEEATELNRLLTKIRKGEKNEND